MRPHPLASQGFTITELVVVIVLLGIVAAVALPRLDGGSDIKAAGHRDELQSVLRYAQKSAVSHRRTLCATLANDGSLALRIASSAGGSCDTDYPGPAGTLPALPPPDVAMSVAADSLTTIHFQPTGKITHSSGVSVGKAKIELVGLRAIPIEGDSGLVGS